MQFSQSQKDQDTYHVRCLSKHEISNIAATFVTRYDANVTEMPGHVKCRGEMGTNVRPALPVTFSLIVSAVNAWNDELVVDVRAVSWVTVKLCDYPWDIIHVSHVHGLSWLATAVVAVIPWLQQQMAGKARALWRCRGNVD